MRSALAMVARPSSNSSSFLGGELSSSCGLADVDEALLRIERMTQAFVCPLAGCIDCYAEINRYIQDRSLPPQWPSRRPLAAR